MAVTVRPYTLIRGLNDAGKVLTVKRNVLVSSLIVVVVVLLLWAGIHNGRQRRLDAEKAQANHAILIPDAANGSSEDVLADLRGKPAPAFTLVSLDGKKVSLADYKGKAVLVNFWATWCGPCKLEMPWFVDFQKKYGDQGFTVLGVAEDDAGKDEIAKFATRMKLDYPVLLADDKVGKAYGGVEYLPTSYYVGRDGKIIEQTAGLISKDEVEANIKKALATSGGQ